MAQVVPSKLREMRACISCSLVKTFDQFVKDGCENCPFLYLQDDDTSVMQCTSSSFHGLAGVMQPDASWVARWQRLGTARRPFVRGVYALSVTGTLPEETIERMRERHIAVVPRQTVSS